MNVKTVLFLCTGNYYRSRFAGHVFNDRARKGGIAWLADSRGLALDETEHRSLMDERFPAWSGTVEYWLVHDLDRTDADSALAQVHAAVVRLLDDLDAECSTA